MLKEQEAGAKMADVCRKHGISIESFHKFKAKIGRMGCPARVACRLCRTRTAD
jgi:phosphoenolpyruvate carboxylase